MSALGRCAGGPFSVGNPHPCHVSSASRHGGNAFETPRGTALTTRGVRGRQSMTRLAQQRRWKRAPQPTGGDDNVEEAASGSELRSAVDKDADEADATPKFHLGTPTNTPASSNAVTRPHQALSDADPDPSGSSPSPTSAAAFVVAAQAAASAAAASPSLTISTGVKLSAPASVAIAHMTFSNEEHRRRSADPFDAAAAPAGGWLRAGTRPMLSPSSSARLYWHSP